MDSEVTPAWKAESAGCLLVRSVPTVHPGTTCGALLDRLRQQHFEYADIAVIVDHDERVLGLISAGELATCASTTVIEHAMHQRVAVATLDTDQERVASLAIDNRLGAVPVVDDDQKFIGLVPPHRLLAVLRREHVEDLHRVAGIVHATEAARAAIEGPPAQRATRRLPWLFVGLAGSALATLIMAQFESVLQAHIAVAFFLPGIVYLADAIGTQTEAIAIRGLSLSHVGVASLLMRELWTGLLIGAILGITAGLAVWAALQDVPLALAVGTAILTAGGIATGIGLLLPWIFQRLGFDPAYGSGPLATVVQDVLSLLVYFSCAGLFLQLWR